MYKTRLNDALKKSGKLKTLRSKISLWRLLCAASAAVFFAFGSMHRELVSFLLSVAAALCFLLLVSWDSRVKKQISYLTDYLAVIDDYQARLGDGWKNFQVHGTRYLADKDAWAHDLDIFGQHSLYQYLCTASSVFGQDQLACWLSQAEDSIQSRQDAVRELAQKTGFTLDYEASARKLRSFAYDTSKKTLDDFFHSLEQTERASLTGKIAIWAAPVLTFAFLAACLSGIEHDLALAGFFGCAMLQLFASFVCHWHNSRLLAPVYRMNQTASPYRSLFALIAQESFDSPYLQQLQHVLSPNHADPAGASSAVRAFQELESISFAIVTRHNAYAAFVLNSLFCYDFHCARRYRRWKQKYRHAVRAWMQAAGCMEALISLGVAARTRQDYTMPKVTASQKPELSATGLKHPLLKDSQAVGNDFVWEHQTCIITGSNMSGKTTFMRSIGANLVLAYAGGFCTATAFQVSRMKICTSMRTADDINAGISTFYAELLHIQKMMEISKAQQPMIALIDEIYKGTNSKDRIFAARETVRKLAKPYAITILTTHDLELCSLEEDPDIDAANYHFCEHYSENKIMFDYKIRQGRCETSNARYLLRMAGILDSD
ncbi:MAG: hypothetical protein K2N87_09240 [Eubacterium sp.]|nr:hypothetical protein [Eubacterium sp.]